MPYWRLSGVYFAYFAVVGALSPYWSLYLDTLGYSAGDIGVLAAIPLVTKLIAPNLWGWISDKTGHRLRVMRWGAFGTCFFFSGLIVLTDYWSLVFLLALYSVFWNAVLPQFEATTLTYLKDSPQNYSKIRVWGSVGFVMTVLGLGVLLEHVHITVLPTIIFFLLVSIFLFTCTLPAQQERGRHPGAQDFFSVVTKKHVMIFYAVLFLLQFSHGVYYVFYSIYLSLYDYSKTQIGVFWTLGVVCEIFLFMRMATLLHRFSRYSLLSISLLATALRWLMIGAFPHNTIVLILAQLLHALSFAVVHAVAIDFIKSSFNESSQGQAQALYSAISFGAGASLGAFVSGQVWSFSPSMCFFIAALAACISWLLTIVFLKARL